MTIGPKSAVGSREMTKEEEQFQLSIGIAAIAITIRCVKAFGRTAGEKVREVVEQELGGICDDRWPNFSRAQWCEFVRMGLLRAYDPGGPLGSGNDNTVQ